VSANGKDPPKIIDDRLMFALSHDTRELALSMCSVRPTSTKEIAEAKGVSISAAWYHVDQLHRRNCLEKVFSEKRRGATEHFYVATCDYYFDSEAWQQVPGDKRLAIVMRILRLIADDVDEAVKAGAVEADDRHLTRIPMDLDPTGQAEAYAVMTQALEDLLVVRKRCAKRKEKNGGQTTPTSLVLMQLELPLRGKT
jgi:predicted ArsR family transcriptional regulator